MSKKVLEKVSQDELNQKANVDNLKQLKVIDFEWPDEAEYDRPTKMFRLYLANPDVKDYWGDDWDDAPYECNAGTVYDRYYCAVLDVYLDWECGANQACVFKNGEYITKQEMMDNDLRCIEVYRAYRFDRLKNNYVPCDDSVFIKYNEDLGTVLQKLFGYAVDVHIKEKTKIYDGNYQVELPTSVFTRVHDVSDINGSYQSVPSFPATVGTADAITDVTSIKFSVWRDDRKAGTGTPEPKSK